MSPTEPSAATEMEPPRPLVSAEDIDSCSFAFWYPLLRRWTFKSVILHPIPQELLIYLRQDGLVLPSSNEVDDESDNSESSTDESDAEIASPPPDLTECTKELQRCIDELGGAVFPKLNWSAPTDAVWITATNTLKCTTPEDIFLLLKGSDRVHEDLNHPYREVTSTSGGAPALRDQPLKDTQTQLVLRQWANLNPSLEFRCFIQNKQIKAITQIDLNYFAFLVTDEPTIRKAILAFYRDQVRPVFPRDNYVMDVYVRSDYGKVYVVDFNPLSEATDTILLTWDVVLQPLPPEVSPTITLFPEHTDSIRFSSTRYSQNRFPVDLNATNFQSSLEKFFDSQR
ncbi:hypothetical protein IWQ62_000162 [Dispira parvispora]|uniref:Cell division cycle protein 123 n=1 Tax=Dispira parvispora TaxID=1520584 RepID=A0A9W8B0N8_9FUNG|nr:hypothetical protein IWQ62_000162 [Dispira parvispora]